MNYSLCVRPAWAKVAKAAEYSRECKSLTGELVKSVGKPQGGCREACTEGRDCNTDSYRYRYNDHDRKG
ncbi:MAG: hypothetical protein ACOYXT_26720 [Bacteroidota bacterium]